MHHSPAKEARSGSSAWGWNRVQKLPGAARRASAQYAGGKLAGDRHDSRRPLFRVRDRQTYCAELASLRPEITRAFPAGHASSIPVHCLAWPRRNRRLKARAARRRRRRAHVQGGDAGRQFLPRIGMQTGPRALPTPHRRDGAIPRNGKRRMRQADARSIGAHDPDPDVAQRHQPAPSGNQDTRCFHCSPLLGMEDPSTLA